MSEDAALYAALQAATAAVCGVAWRQEETGAEFKVGRCLVDANWGDKTALVYEFCRRSPHAAVLLPSHGKWVGAKHNPVSSWQVREGERGGPGWRLTPAGSGRHVTFDANLWKSFTADRLRTPAGGAGRWAVHAPGPAGHTLLFDHLTAEAPREIEEVKTGRRVDEWEKVPGRDNDWFDCLVGCAVAASVEGLRWSAGAAAGEPETPPGPRERRSLKQLRAAAAARRSTAARG